MKRVVRSLLLFFCTILFILSASVCVCVVPVHADGATYTLLTVGQCYEFGQSSGNSLYQSRVFDSPVRAVALSKDSFRVIIAVYDQDFLWAGTTQGGSFGSCPVPSNNATTIPGHTGYYYWRSVTYKNYNTYDIPVFQSTGNDTNDLQYAFSLTYGDDHIDPTPPTPTPTPTPSYGLVDLEGYQTQVAGQGNASINNVDVISWNDTFDTNNNDISTGNVRVRYVPGYYRATSKQNLLAQTFQDFVLDIISAVNGDVYPVSDGSASFRWGDVIGSLSIPFYSIYNLTNSTEGWLKRGWIYEVRLEIDDYIGEWQTVYSSTSSGVENDMTIVNTTVITQETITAIQNINSINSTTNIWIINGQPVDPNPEITPPADDDEKPWWVYLLEMINNTLGIQNEYINEGTNESIEVVNNFEEDHDDLNVTVNDYDDIENTIVNDMNDNLDDLDIESDLIENNNFLSSARWVAEQYTRITTDNPIGSILKFSLVLGFVMIFLGRFK